MNILILKYDINNIKGLAVSIHMAGHVNEIELFQMENHMTLVHGIMLQLTTIANKNEQMVLIIDLKKIKSKIFSNKMINSALDKIIGLSLQYFPGFLYKGFIVNAPMSFSSLWSKFESRIPVSTREKIRIIGASSDPEISSLVFPLLF